MYEKDTKLKNISMYDPKIENVINPLNEIEPNKISYEVKKIIDDYIADLKNKEVNYNLYLQSKPILVIQYLEELGYSKFNRYSQFGHNILLFKHKDKQFTELELFMDYLNFKCYLLNTHPAKKFGE